MNKEFYFYGNTVVCYLYDRHTDRTFKGVAVCSPEDTYDRNTGMEIAKLKALHKLQVYKMKKLSEIKDMITYWKSIEDEVSEQYKLSVDKAEKVWDQLINITNDIK